jgi:hypothetical protein
VKEKFTVNCGEAPDLSAGLAFESHHALQQRQNPNREGI